MKKWIVFAALFCFLLAGCGADDMRTVVVVTKNETDGEGETLYVQLLENTPVAEIEGEPISPDGRYEVVTEGASEHYVSGVRLPETLQIVNTETGEVLWEDMGYLWQSALWSPELSGQAAWYELQVKRTDRTLLWEQDAAESHAGWTSIFALELNGKEYLLRYSPWMGQGNTYYNYQIFFLDENGEEVLYQENGVEFDINFGSPIHQSFDAADIAAFLEEVHGYLDESTLLISTEGGTFRTGGSGVEFREDAYFWDDDCPYDNSKTLLENIQTFEAFLCAVQEAA